MENGCLKNQLANTSKDLNGARYTLQHLCGAPKSLPRVPLPEAEYSLCIEQCIKWVLAGLRPYGAVKAM